MTKTSFTPGPWTWNENGDCWLEGANHSTILHVDYQENRCPHRTDPDARLIAAAPNLYKACLRIILESSPDLPPTLSAIEQCTQAVARAEGRETNER